MARRKNEHVQLALFENPYDWGTFDQEWLPKRPLASNEKTGPYHRVNRDQALEKSYIESNPEALKNFIIIDHDAGEASHIASRLGLPDPSYIALNPHTKDGHIGYVLKEPITTTDAARIRPMHYLASIEETLTRVLDGDPQYAGKITKNPYHHTHIGIWGDSIDTGTLGHCGLIRKYSLKELLTPLKELSLLTPYKHPTPLTYSTLGRNCYVFDTIRKWSYPQRKKHTNKSTWEHAIFAKAWELNESFIAQNWQSGPLPYREIGSIANSIAGWTWNRIRYVPGEHNSVWSQKQAQLGKKGGRVSKRKPILTEEMFTQIGKM